MLQCYFCNLKKIFLRISPLLQSVAAVCAHQCSLFLDLRVANSYFFISIRMLAISAIFHGNCPTRARKVLFSICSSARRKPFKPAHNPTRNPTPSTTQHQPSTPTSSTPPSTSSTPGFAATGNFCVSPLLRYSIRIFYSGRTMISPGSVCLL